MAQFTPPRLPTIPFPEENLKSLLATVVALKQAVEINVGARGDWPMTHTFVSQQEPQAFNVGDLWINPFPAATMSYWTGVEWKLFARAQDDGLLHST